MVLVVWSVQAWRATGGMMFMSIPGGFSMFVTPDSTDGSLPVPIVSLGNPTRSVGAVPREPWVVDLESFGASSTDNQAGDSLYLHQGSLWGLMVLFLEALCEWLMDISLGSPPLEVEGCGEVFRHLGS